MSEHTKTPWRVEEGTTLIWGNCTVYDDGTPDYLGIAIAEARTHSPWRSREELNYDIAEANAALIVTAVNAYEPDQARIAELTEALRDLRSQADRHYCRSLDQFSKTECLGWEAKVRTGVFGKPEFEAHAEANLRMGRHQGMMEAVKRISEILESAALEKRHD